MTRANIDSPTAEAAASSTKALVAGTLPGGGILAFGGWTANDIAMAIGAVVAVVGLAVQWYYRHREFKLREREHHARMARHSSVPSHIQHEADE